MEVYHTCGAASTWDEAEAFKALSNNSAAVVAANINLERFPFQPYGVISFYITLGEALVDLGQKDEARQAFEAALRESRRIKFFFYELMVLKAAAACGVIGDDERAEGENWCTEAVLSSLQGSHES